MAKLLDREDEDSRETYARVLAEESRTQAIRARMDRGDLSRDAMPLDLRCPTCGETNSYLVSGVVVPGKTDDQLPYLIEDELPCASCGREVEFEFTPTAILGVSAELMLMQAASSTRQDREPLIRLQNIQIDGQVIPIAAGLRQIRKRLDDHPTDGRSWFRLANILNDLKRPRAALSALEKAAACAPHVVDVIVSRVELLTNQDREAESLDILCKALDQQFAWQFWGNTHVIGRQFVELYNHLRKTQGRQDLPAMHPASIRPPQPAKVGRNDSCPCGSGKKYKKCCG
jgi:tetratricopeptide (TPR) repeat protein